MPTKPQQARRYRSVPTLLRSIREEAGLTQRDLALQFGKGHAWVYNCETGNRRVDVSEFIDWCKACNVDPVVGLRRLMALR